ncbi:unnamed protein product [Triticum turgidum subsp. durum]|uniref:Protein kinase domain-containing protein n=1 Tax=Triticum turgidum subsp. durum TaxID=4567 RepID=A0A9R0SJA6_TRITD|nr:unnamed protein product [Triticum turgidum subsp. durum]
MLSSCVSIAAAVVLLLISATAAAAGPPRMKIGMPGCNTTCGNVSVPYPFGMGPKSCYWPGFKLTCNNNGSKPPRLLLGEGSGGVFEVVDISLKNSTMRIVNRGLRAINMSDGSGQWIIADAKTIGAGGVAYLLNPGSNEFILTGCNVQATLLANRSLASGCASFCPEFGDGISYTQTYKRGNSKACSNIGCCQSTIQTASASFGVELKQLNYSGVYSNFSSHVNVLIAEVGWFDVDHNLEVVMNVDWRANKNLSREADQLRVPVILAWALAHDAAVYNTGHSRCPRDAARGICKSTNSNCSVGNTIEEIRGYSCHCKEGYEGNPYLTGGCQDIKECNQKEKHFCFGVCEELSGSFRCRCPNGTHGNYTKPGGCIIDSVDTIRGNKNMGLVIGLSVASGPFILLLVLGALLITRGFKQHKTKVLRQKFFSQNRGQLFKQLVSHRADIAERMLISLEEIEKATNNFDQARKLGGGGHGTVYKGIMLDLHVVAIKKSNIVVKREINEFINEVAILSQINHRNIVKLRGCCLETEVPLLAYEFISNGTLAHHLHTEERALLPWKDRLRITSETGKALAYLHSAMSVTVIHRDIKPSNILLDDALTAKVSDFGASRYIIPMDHTGTTTAVQGTIGYLDPMYYYTGRLTESSDVYSFGVLLVELLTRRKPSVYRSSEGDGLVMQFVALLAEGDLEKILDPQVIEEGGSEVKEVATLAMECVKLRAEERPTMRQVEMALEALQAPNKRVQADLVEETDEKEYAATGYPSTSQQAKKNEGSRCYSQEDEFLLSATYPR